MEIPYYSTPPTYNTFLKEHLIPNRPCIIGPALTEEWKARSEWIVPNTEKLTEAAFKPKYDFLRARFGSVTVPVAQCHRRQFTDQLRTPMKFEDFVNLWEADDKKVSHYYSKDFHLMRSFPEYKFYCIPEIFQGTNRSIYG